VTPFDGATLVVDVVSTTATTSRGSAMFTEVLVVDCGRAVVAATVVVVEVVAAAVLVV